MNMITCVYTGMGGLPEKIEAIFKEKLGDVKIRHIVDSTLIADIVKKGEVTEDIKNRIFSLYDAAAEGEHGKIISTCSSIGEVTDEYAVLHPETDLMRIDFPMAKYAAEHGKKVIVMATLSTTVAPSAGLVRKLAERAGRSVEIKEITVPGAFDAMVGGDMKRAEELVRRCAQEECREADIILLAQASMSFFKETLRDVLGEDILLLESPSACAEYLQK